MSVAVKVAAVGTALHSTVMFVGKASIKVGGVVSSIVKILLIDAELLHASKTVKVLVTTMGQVPVCVSW